MQSAFLQYFGSPRLPYQMEACVAPHSWQGPPSIIAAKRSAQMIAEQRRRGFGASLKLVITGFWDYLVTWQ